MLPRLLRAATSPTVALLSLPAHVLPFPSAHLGLSCLLPLRIVLTENVPALHGSDGREKSHRSRGEDLDFLKYPHSITTEPSPARGASSIPIASLLLLCSHTITVNARVSRGSSNPMTRKRTRLLVKYLCSMYVLLVFSSSIVAIDCCFAATFTCPFPSQH